MSELPHERTFLEDALDGLDAEAVDIVELLPAIFAAVPGANHQEIIAALRWAATRSFHEADQLERYHNAKFGGGDDA